MPTKKKTETKVEEVVQPTPAPETKKNSLAGLFVTGKHPQIRKSKTCDPKSPSYDPKVAKNRKKEKARRHHNAVMRARGK